MKLLRKILNHWLLRRKDLCHFCYRKMKKDIGIYILEGKLILTCKPCHISIVMGKEDMLIVP